MIMRILQLLLDSNASLDHIINQLSTTLGTTPLHLAAKLNETQPYFPVRNPTLAQLRETQYVRILLQAKSNVNLQNDYDNNALWERCEQIFNCQNSTGVDDIVKLLIDAKSELNYGRDGNFSPLNYSSNWQTHTDLVEYLLDAKCKI